MQLYLNAATAGEFHKLPSATMKTIISIGLRKDFV